MSSTILQTIKCPAWDIRFSTFDYDLFTVGCLTAVFECLDPFTDFTNTSLPPTVTPQHYLGDLIGGTFCSRVFTDCNRKDCRLQSPNFPGVYPRNLTCYYAIRQQEVKPSVWFTALKQ